MKKKFTVIKFFAFIKTGKECVITSVRQLANYFTGALLFFCILLLPAAAFSQSWLWAKSAGGTSEDYGKSVTTDATGSVFVTGYFYSPFITFGTYTLTNVNTGYPDVFLVKYDPSGNVLWAKSAGGTSDDYGCSVTTDATGNVFVTGYFKSSSITFGTYTLTNAGYDDIFLVKYDPSGNVLWAKSAGGTSDDEGYSVTTDATENVFVTGYFSSSSITFGTDTLTNAGSDDIFLVKYDGNGNVLWAKSAGGTNDERGYSVTTDATGNVFVTGYFESSSITFGTDTLTNAGASGSADIFLVKYDPADGGVLWAKSADGTNNERGYSVTTDATGNVFVTGTFEISSITFGTYTLTNAGYYDIFLVKYNSSGNVLWAKNAGGTNYDFSNSVTTAPTGNVFVTGCFYSSSITFGTYTLTNAGSGDIFVAKLDTVTGIEEISTEHNITIYPNPATTEITILTPSLSKGEGEWAFMLYDMLGHEVYNTKLETINSKINLSTLPSGVYLVKVMCKSDVWTSKVIIQSELK